MPYLETRLKHLDWDRRFAVCLFPPPKDRLGTLHGEYRYKLEGTPQQDDCVIRLIRDTIRHLSKNHMLVAAASITVHALSSGPCLLPLSIENAQCPVKMYAFRAFYEEFPLTVPVSIVDRGSPRRLTADRILVEIDRVWQPLKSWLLEFPSEEFLLRDKYQSLVTQ
ncbi:hypothetical protein BDV95DRAFT_604680 [Massariosphaeria phaeospora]|uniref:Uncharacterized protein n=1 Tax=Massariosphaeria phaeospora TaxID=100035 RepID=A0A7C8ICC7_9PLEO|nr:hypothetical protein BDV95DRAFT_604680 [Massariosphaeria phaeospora]